MITTYSPKSSRDKNLLLNNQELAGYRRIIQQMQYEIGNLNRKISDIEKIKVPDDTLRKANTNNILENKLDIDRNQTLEEKIRKLESIVDNLANFNRKSTNSSKFLFSPVSEQSYNMIGDKNEKINKSTVTKNILPSKTGVASKTTLNDVKNSNRSKRYNSENKIKKISGIGKKPFQKSPNIKVISNKVSKEKYISTTFDNKTNSSSIPNNNSEESLSLREEIKQLKEKLNELEKFSNNKAIQEVKFWKNRCDVLASNYYESINSLRIQIKEEKTNFLEQIKNLNIECLNQVEEVNLKYQNILAQCDWNITKLKKENEELRKKFSKVKNILNTSKAE